MKKIYISLALFLSIFGMLSQGISHAEVTPQALPTDSRMVVVKYNPAQIVTILTAPFYMTHIELEAGEKLEIDPALGDTIQWEVESKENHVFIKPDVQNIRTNMSLVTNKKRTYQFSLIASPEGGIYYQYVQFKYPEIKNRLLASSQPADHVESPQDQPTIRVKDPSSLNSNYKISGDAKFRPDFVQDDGKFTWIKFPSDLTELPMIYAKENGSYVDVNYTPKPKNNYVTVTKTADEFLLVLDKEEVRITKKKTGFW
ncbi:TrbG/VirB9 family P-type conjugative transfer protein [Undibacterium oligocarboniphilum]|uniref:TrbG/VirB9 family P-type conjugative transfer protein n=1 Tax=Undibacterium oligocarboniphilum TaxID=666702 RepID=A0A850QI72_9BURK|nr:TrbG/VirB9 family P-type conjugative transfer protein [Undibacterium oligocarboniphilum]MBC3871436.1 TrbG/VirB9 family P-type conjugative transfer protein [Undibacterium oligocarboniphilum]NVO78988.1 TrbG/VirB9 family P-type conjugative transfer protein [Undibacterium oligocarboniphilum]